MKGKICGCWCDSVDLPMLCAFDDPKSCPPADCSFIGQGMNRKQCGHWNPMKTMELVASLTGLE